MATATKTFSWTSDLESWTNSGAGGLFHNIAYDATGYSGGCMAATAGKKNTAENRQAMIEGTWADLFGIASGATVDYVRIYSGQTRTTEWAFTNSASYDAIVVEPSGGGTPIATVWAGRSTTDVEGSWTAISAGSNQTIDEPASTTRRFGIGYAISTANNNGYATRLKWDEITLEITYSPPTPSISSVTPNETPEMSAVEVVIAGENFTGATAVTVGGHAATTYNVDSSVQITATLPAHAAEADLQVQVTTSAGSSSDVAGDNFTYYQDEISIERKDTGSYAEVYSGPWIDGTWTDVEAGLVNGTTYYYQATRTTKGVASGYSNEEVVVYSTGAVFRPQIIFVV